MSGTRSGSLRICTGFVYERWLLMGCCSGSAMSPMQTKLVGCHWSEILQLGDHFKQHVCYPIGRGSKFVLVLARPMATQWGGTVALMGNGGTLLAESVPTVGTG